MSRPVMVRAIDDDQARLLQIMCPGGRSPVVTGHRAQMALLSARGMDVAAIAKVASSDRGLGSSE